MVLLHENSNLVKIGEIANFFGVTTQCIREWEKSGRVKSTRSAKGTRLFDLTDFRDSTTKYTRVKIFYCRVSSVKQKEDLERQIKLAKQEYPEHEVISDIGSGLNWKRKGLRKILARSAQGEVQEVVVFHRDRLCRFGFELIEYMLNLHEARLLVHDQEEHKSKADELSEDLMAIAHVFSCSFYGSRKYKSKEDQILPNEASGEDSEDVV